MKRDKIVIWRPRDIPQLELRRGFAVAAPVPRHWHEDYQLCLIESGGGDLNYRGTTFPTPPATLFIVFPGEVHSNRATVGPGCTYRTIYVDPKLMQQSATEIHDKQSGIPFFPTTVLFEQDVIRKYFELHLALEHPSTSLERQTLLLELLADLLTRFAEYRSSSLTIRMENAAVQRVCDYLIAHYSENVRLGDLARIANLSGFHLNRVFSKHLGMPPHAFQTQVRVLRAKALLLKGWSISQAAMETGFADQSHLTRHFKRLLLVPPGHYVQSSKNFP
ncbi:AraC family transcriptional regulator [bacterium]|nr:AraC family transcriptional regulator [bacterium]